MISPARAYARYARLDGGNSLWTGARRPLFVALLQGVAISMAATESVAVPVVASVTACWAIAVAVQAVAALLLIRSAPAPRVGVNGALDLFFLGHAPWSLWLLVSAASMVLASSIGLLRWVALATMIVPAALTPRIVAAFDEAVLGSTRRAAVRRAILHQGLIWTTLFVYIAAGIGLWPRVIGVFQP